MKQRFALIFVLAVAIAPMVSANAISYWDLDNQTDQIDGNDLTEENNVLTSNNYPTFNQSGNSSPDSADFDQWGDNTRYRIGNPSNLATNSWANDSITTTMWLNIPSGYTISTTKNILAHGGANENDDYTIQYDGSASEGLSIYVDGGDGGGKAYISPSNVPKDEWIFVVG